MYPDEEIKYEKILHTVWSEQLFTCSEFTTTASEEVRVINPGYLNHSDGPDFLNAAIQIGNIIHYGAVEIHLNSRDWNSHRHHTDSNYNKVILHVVADVGDTSDVRTKIGENIPTVNIRPFLPDQVNELIGAISGSNLPCSTIVNYISEDAFTEQLAISRQEYLDKKVQDFYAFYDPSEGLADAWKKALMVSLADSLGISQNRSTMVEAAHIWLDALNTGIKFTSGKDFAHAAIDQHRINFSRKGVRPAHRPELRLPQLHRVMLAIHGMDLSVFLDGDIQQNWKSILEQSGIAKNGFAKIIYGTVFLPAHLALSQLVFSNALKSKVFDEWFQLQVLIPEHIRKKFAIFPDQLYTQTRKNLGAVHLYHAYCKEKRCLECKVLNKAILS
ncbi:MAG: DUF2851 family protein [Balneolaceae bacterium]|nr:DUF2851 family protein [Balneolaceae bacterium]